MDDMSAGPTLWVQILGGPQGYWPPCALPPAGVRCADRGQSRPGPLPGRGQLQRVKLAGFDVVIAELEVEQLSLIT